jgi:hypothetical protein
VTRRASSSGYAVLAVLLLSVLAATFALAVVGAVHALQAVRAADAEAGRAAVLETEAVAQAAGRLRWAPPQTTGSLSGADASRRERWTADWEVAPPVGHSPWPRRRLRVSATASSARRTCSATIELRAEEWAVGVSCEHDAEIDEPLSVSGTGLYVGGVLRGREQVTFLPGGSGTTPDGRPVDGARGDGTSVAAVHAEAGIFSEGVEIHEQDPAEFRDDGDQHAGVAAPAAWVAGPTPELLAAAQGKGKSPGVAWSAGTLRLDAIGPADPTEAVAGRCLVLPAGDEATILGSAPADGGPLLVVVPGDAVVGQPGERVFLRGGLVVCGRLHVNGELVLEGSLHAGSLIVSADTSVTVPPDWRDRPLPGAAEPFVVELSTQV